MQTSKILTYSITSFFLLSIVAIGFVQVKFNVDLSNLLNYIAPIEGTIIFAYFSKSGVENYIKIKGTTDELVNLNYQTSNNNTQGDV